MRRMRADLSQTTQSASLASQGFAALGRSVTALAAGAIGFAAIKSGVEGIVRAGLDLERLRNSFTAITGSAQQSRQEFTFVRDTSLRLGLELQTLGDSYRGLLAATRGTNLEGQGTRDLFTALTNASRIYGLSTDQTGRALLAFQQIISKGKVSQEELRGQLGEALPGASQIAARAFGVTTRELDKLIEKGVESTEFVRRFTEQLSREAPPATTVAGKGIANLGTEILLLKDRIAQSGVLPFFDRLAQRGADVLARQRAAADLDIAERNRTLRGQGVNPDTATGEAAKRVQELAAVNIELKAAEQQIRAFLARESPDRAPSEALIASRNALEALRARQQQLIQEIGQEGIERQRTGAIAAQENARRTDELRGQAAEREADAQRTKDRFAEIDADTKRQIDLEEEQARAQKKAADERVDLFGRVQKAQEGYLEGLEDEFDRLVLTNQELSRFQRFQLGIDDDSKLGRRVIALQDELEIRKALASIPSGPLGQDDIGAAAAQFRKDTIREEARARREDFKDAENQTREFARFFSESILNATDIAQRGFRGFVDSVVADLQRLLVRQYLAPRLLDLVRVGLQAASGFFSAGSGVPAGQGGSVPAGDSGGNLFSFAQRAGGGPVMGPGLTLVGETGPEILALGQGQRGYVYPPGTGPGMGNITVNVSFHLNDATGLRRSLGEIEQRMAQAVRRALQAS